jgi:ATP-binding cassette subfamily B protein
VSIRILFGYVARYRARYLAGFALLLVTTACSLSIPWVIKVTVDHIGAGGLAGAGAVLWVGPAAIVGLAVAQALTRIASRLCLLGASQRVEADLRADLFRRLTLLPPAFYQAHRTGDLMSRATNDLQTVAGALIGFGFLSLVATALVLVGTLIAMLRLDPWLTLAALAPVPVVVAAARWWNGQIHVESQAVQEELARLSARAQENFSGMAVVRAYAMETREVEAFGRLNAEYLRRMMRLVRTQSGFSPLMSAIGGLGMLIVLWLGGQAVVAGRMTLGGFIAFSSYLGYLTWPMLAVGWTLSMVRRGLVALDRVVAILRAEPIVVDGPEAVDDPGPPRGELELRGLTFAYGGGGGRGPALRDVRLRIAAGERVAVVGPTGSGKSTLAALLTRLEDPPPGTVFVDGREIHTIPLAVLRRTVAVVPQETFLFSRSLAENVVLGGDAGDERLRWAGRVAGLAGDVGRLPAGWGTVVGERGLTLSGGQRQRVALARALLADPRVLVLDDAFASVDAETEAAILAELREALAGRTALIITHRLGAARLADRVVVLDEGTVVEEGTHAALLARGGLYARLWRRQQLEAELEVTP